MNNNLVLICGKSATGKSLSLMNLKDPKGVRYLNCENNKDLPFKSDFDAYTITDPLQVYEAFLEAENHPEIHTIVVDSLTFLMSMYESQYVLGSTNTMQMWGEYAQYFKRLMSQYVAKSTKNVIFTAHTLDILNESEMVMETVVKVKGSLMNEGIEAYFSTVIGSKRVKLKQLATYGSDLLNISPEEERLEFKYCFQVKLTKDTVNERIRSSLGMWETKETYIDNCVQNVIDRLHTYYK
jgi:hypothetical protein